MICHQLFSIPSVILTWPFGQYNLKVETNSPDSEINYRNRGHLQLVCMYYALLLILEWNEITHFE